MSPPGRWAPEEPQRWGRRRVWRSTGQRAPQCEGPGAGEELEGPEEGKRGGLPVVEWHFQGQGARRSLGGLPDSLGLSGD